MVSGKKLLLSGIVALALVGGVVGSAAAAPPPPTQSAGASQQGWRGAGAGFGAGFGYSAISGVASAAKLLGMTPEELHAERLAGKSLGQIADSKGVSRDSLVNAMLDSRKSLLDARVKAGSMTQDQENAALAAMKTNMTQSLDRTQVGPNRTANRQGLGLAFGRGGFEQGFGPGPRR